MAFAIPVVIAAAAGVGIGGTAIGLAMNLKEKMKHTTISITHLMNLTEGMSHPSPSSVLYYTGAI